MLLQRSRRRGSSSRCTAQVTSENILVLAQGHVASCTSHQLRRVFHSDLGRRESSCQCQGTLLIFQCLRVLLVHLVDIADGMQRHTLLPNVHLFKESLFECDRGGCSRYRKSMRWLGQMNQPRSLSYKPRLWCGALLETTVTTLSKCGLLLGMIVVRRRDFSTHYNSSATPRSGILVTTRLKSSSNCV